MDCLIKDRKGMVNSSECENTVACVYIYFGDFFPILFSIAYIKLTTILHYKIKKIKNKKNSPIPYCSKNF